MMKSNLLLAAAVLGLTSVSHAAPNDNLSKSLQIYPKNVARQHLGTNLFVYDSTNKSYKPTEAAAAWLDDDVSTGWPPMNGKTYYLLALPEADLLTNFMVSAKSSAGTISLYAGDELAEPGAKSWSPIASDLDLSTINNCVLEQPFSRFAKYLLIETNLTETGPWYSLYAYGERSAVSYTLEKRTSAIDLASIFGPYTNDQTAFSFSSLYTGGRVAGANASSGEVSWQKAIDDNPQTSLAVAPSADTPGLVIRFGDPLAIQRVAVLANGKPEGKLDFFLVETLEATTPVAAETASKYIKVANPVSSGTQPSGTADLAGATPTATMILDGTTARSSIDFPATQSGYLLVRWTPSDGQSELALSEINSFTSASLSTYKLESNLPVVGELSEGTDDSSKDGKTFADFKGGKEAIPPAVGEFLPTKNPFVPAGLGFPANLTNTAVAGPEVLETPASP